MLNKAILIGNLGRDPEVRATGSGRNVINFSVATSETYKDSKGEVQKKTEWHHIVVWDRMGETCLEYLAKGSLVYVEGRIQTRKWEGKDGNERHRTEVVASKVTFLDKKKDGAQKKDKPADDDIPF